MGGAGNASEPRDYRDVQALQLSIQSACQTLTVLRNGTIDGWDLNAGRKIGSWRLGSTLHTAMCHDGRDVFLAHPGDEDGPVVETVPLPAALANCAVPQQAEQVEVDVALAKQAMMEQALAGRIVNV